MSKIKVSMIKILDNIKQFICIIKILQTIIPYVSKISVIYQTTLISQIKQIYNNIQFQIKTNHLKEIIIDEDTIKDLITILEEINKDIDNCHYHLYVNDLVIIIKDTLKNLKTYLKRININKNKNKTRQSNSSCEKIKQKYINERKKNNILRKKETILETQNQCLLHDIEKLEEKIHILEDEIYNLTHKKQYTTNLQLVPIFAIHNFNNKYN